MEKDLLLEKSKEMLKIAAEREDDLLREVHSIHFQSIMLMLIERMSIDSTFKMDM